MNIVSDVESIFLQDPEENNENFVSPTVERSPSSFWPNRFVYRRHDTRHNGRVSLC
jgi:hypothetical protein